MEDPLALAPCAEAALVGELAWLGDSAGFCHPGRNRARICPPKAVKAARNGGTISF